MLTYNMAAPAVLRPQIVDDNRKRFTPPVDVFEIELVNVRTGAAMLHDHCRVHNVRSAQTARRSVLQAAPSRRDALTLPRFGSCLY